MSVQGQILADTVLDSSFLSDHVQTTLSFLYWFESRAMLTEKEKDTDWGGRMQQNTMSLEPKDESDRDRLETGWHIWEDEVEVATA